MIKSVSVFSASSDTGVCVVNAANQKGLNVRVLLDCRAGERPKRWGETVEVVEGDILDIQHVKTTLEGQDAAVVVLGSNDGQDDLCVTCEALKNIVAVMELLYIKVVSICFPTDDTSQPGDVAAEYQSQMAKVLEASSLHWVAVVAPRVTDDAATGYAIVRDRGPSGRPQTAVSRRDLAAFLVDCLSMPERYQKTVKISSFARR